MTTLILQSTVTGLIVTFAVLSLLVARRGGAAKGLHTAAWALTGWAFLVHGANSVLQSVWGIQLMGLPLESAPMQRFLHWVPVLNHSRTGLLAAYFGTLLALVFLRDPPGRRFWGWAAAALAAGMALGALWGWREGALVPAHHFAAVAWWDAVELLLVFAAMFGLLVTNRADRLLWAALSCYAVSLALGALWFNLFSFLADPNVWVPPTWTMHAMRASFRALMVAIAGYRLYLAVRRREVPGLFDSVGRHTVSLGIGR